MLDVLQELDVVPDGKDGSRCVGSAKMFQAVQCLLDCVFWIQKLQSYSTKAIASRENRWLC
jgi:hypothetical protein